jgi:hypothetical protein
MKKVLIIIIVAMLFMGCGNKDEAATQTQVNTGSEVKAQEVKAASGNDSDIAGSYKYAIDLIKAEAQKNGVMVDAFELREAEPQYLTPAQVMNGWESNVKLIFRYALKENTGTTWYDLDDAKYDAGGWYASLAEDHTFSVRRINGQYILENSEKLIKYLNTAYSYKSWLKKN